MKHRAGFLRCLPFSHAIVLSVLSSSVLLTTSCFETRDTIPYSMRALASMPIQQPPPVGQRVVRARDIDILELVPGNRLLVGAWLLDNWGDYGLVMRPQEIMMMDGALQDVAWKRQVEDSKTKSRSLLSAEPVVLLHVIEEGEDAEARLDAYETSTGAPKWTRSLPTSTHPTVLPDLGIVVLASLGNQGARLSSLQLGNGQEAWSADLEGGLVDATLGVSMLTAPPLLVASSSGVAAIDPASGKLHWSCPGSAGERAVVLSIDDALLVGVGKDVVKRAHAGGRVLWRSGLPSGPVRLLAATASLIVAAVDSKQGSGVGSLVVALDRDSGALRWSSKPEELVSSNLLISEGRLFYATTSQLKAVDLKDGKALFTKRIPLGLVRSWAMPYILVLRNNRIHLASETGVALFDPAQGDVTFAHAIGEGLGATSAYLRSKVLSMAVGSKLIKVQGDSSSQSGTAALASVNGAMSQMAMQHSWTWLSSYQQWSYSATQNVLSSSSSTSSDRMAALQSREFSQGIAQGAGGIMQAGQGLVGLAQATAQLSGSLMNLADALEGLELGHRLSYLFDQSEAQIRVAMLNHANALSSDWYIRPFYKEGAGWGFAVINLEKGQRADLFISPPNPALSNPDYPNLPVYDLDPANHRLVVKGLGLDPKAWEPYEVRGWREGIYHPVWWRIPHPSVLVFDLNQLQYRPVLPTEAELQESPRLSEQDQALLTAALSGDEDRVEALLKGGAHVNAQDEYGRTALMMAALAGSEDVIELLGEHGADPRVRDAEGWSTLEYSTLAPRGVEVVSEARAAVSDLLGAFKSR